MSFKCTLGISAVEAWWSSTGGSSFGVQLLARGCPSLPQYWQCASEGRNFWRSSVSFKCGEYAMLKAKYILKVVMKTSSRPARWHTPILSTFPTLNPLPVIAIFQSLSIGCMVRQAVAGPPCIKQNMQQIRFVKVTEEPLMYKELLVLKFEYFFMICTTKDKDIFHVFSVTSLASKYPRCKIRRLMFFF